MHFQIILVPETWDGAVRIVLQFCCVVYSSVLLYGQLICSCGPWWSSTAVDDGYALLEVERRGEGNRVWDNYKKEIPIHLNSSFFHTQSLPLTTHPLYP